MINRKTMSLIREIVEAELRAIMLSESRKIAGYEVDDLSYAERDELESFVSGYISRDQIESHKVRALVAAGPKVRSRRDPDDVSSMTKKQSGLSTTPAAPKPVTPGKRLGDISGWHESLRVTDRFGRSQNKETGEWSRFRIKTRQADPHWVWTGKRWVSDTEFDRLSRMGYLPER